MEKCLLSVDWDYFIYTQYNSGSYTEDRRSLIDGWYKRYIRQECGRRYSKSVQTFAEAG